MMQLNFEKLDESSLMLISQPTIDNIPLLLKTPTIQIPEIIWLFMYIRISHRRPTDRFLQESPREDIRDHALRVWTSQQIRLFAEW